MSKVKFENNCIDIIAKLDAAAIAFLHEAGVEITRQTQQNTRIDTGQTKNSWIFSIDESKGECTIGSPSENAIYEEFGTGEFALEGTGRKGGWWYKDDKGNWHHTFGKAPRRALNRAFNKLKNPLIKRANEILKESLK